MKRCKLLKSLAALALGTWIPDWVPAEIVSTPGPAPKPTPDLFEPWMLDVPLRKIFAEHMKDTPPEYTRWLTIHGKRGF